MEEPHFVKCEPGWLSDTEESCNLEEYMHVPTDHLKIKIEPHNASTEQCVEGAYAEVAERELDVEMPNLLSSMTGDKLAEVKFELHPVRANKIFEEAGGSVIKEEHEVEIFSFMDCISPKNDVIQNVKVEAQDEACNTMADTLQDLENAAVLTGLAVHTCESCRKRFKRRCDLKRHILTHTGERPYQCTVCECTFPHKSTLKDHLLTHSGEKPFLCSTCGNTFRKLANLRKHENTHTEFRPYSCSICSKTFKSSLGLKMHENYTH